MKRQRIIYKVKELKIEWERQLIKEYGRSRGKKKQKLEQIKCMVKINISISVYKYI